MNNRLAALGIRKESSYGRAVPQTAWNRSTEYHRLGFIKGIGHALGCALAYFIIAGICFELVPLIGPPIGVIFFILCFGTALSAPFYGFLTMRGDCPYCFKPVTVFFNRQSFKCRRCKCRILVNRECFSRIPS